MTNTHTAETIRAEVQAFAERMAAIFNGATSQDVAVSAMAAALCSAEARDLIDAHSGSAEAKASALAELANGGAWGRLDRVLANCGK